MGRAHGVPCLMQLQPPLDSDNSQGQAVPQSLRPIPASLIPRAKSPSERIASLQSPTANVCVFPDALNQMLNPSHCFPCVGWVSPVSMVFCGPLEASSKVVIQGMVLLHCLPAMTKNFKHSTQHLQDPQNTPAIGPTRPQLHTRCKPKPNICQAVNRMREYDALNFSGPITHGIMRGPDKEQCVLCML